MTSLDRPLPNRAGELPWFHVREVEPLVHLVAEPLHVSSWLIAGSDVCVLLDTGLGVAPLRSAIAAASGGRPVRVITSHAHFDHVGGNHEFGDRVIHRAGAELLVDAPQPRIDGDILALYAEAAAGTWASWCELYARDGPSRLIGPDEVARPWPPAGFSLERWRRTPPPATALLDDGDVLDLGDRSLRVVHTPGHALDHVCLVDERAGILFAQDHAYYGTHLLNLDGSSLADWTSSMARLAEELAGAIRVIYTGHCLRWSVPPATLRDLARAGEATLIGAVEAEDALDPFGQPCRRTRFGHFDILTPPGT